MSVQAEDQMSVQMEDLAQGNCHGRIVWMGLHEVLHVLPPSEGDSIGSRHVLGIGGPFGHFLIAEEDIGVTVPVDAVVLHPSLLDLSDQFWPEGCMASLVFLLAPWLEEHLKGKSFHKSEAFQ